MYLEMFLVYWRAASTPPSQRCSITSTSSAGGRPVMGRRGRWGEKDRRDTECAVATVFPDPLLPNAFELPGALEQLGKAQDSPAHPCKLCELSAQTSPYLCRHRAVLVSCQHPVPAAALLTFLSRGAVCGSEPRQQWGRCWFLLAGLLSRVSHNPRSSTKTLPAYLCHSFPCPKACRLLQAQGSPRRGSP